MALFEKPVVFINYRRADSLGEARNLNNDIENAFGDGFVFRDYDDLKAGTLWRDKLKEAGDDAKVIVAVIGPDWLQLDKNGVSRLHNPGDWVRKELEQAIASKKHIIPVLIKDAEIPNMDAIPKSLHHIFNHQLFEISDEKWNLEITALIKDISALSGIKTQDEVELKIEEEEEKRILEEQRKKLEEEKIKVEEEKSKRKQIVWISSTILTLVLLIGGYYLTRPDSNFNKGSSSGTDIPVDDLDGKTNNTITPGQDDKPPEGNRSEANKPFCPEFASSAGVKTLLYPFGEVVASDINFELIVQNKISSACEKYNITGDIQTPNISDNTNYTNTQARSVCGSCPSDIFITGLTFKEGSGKAGFNAKIGFCDSLFAGYKLDDQLNIVSNNSSISDLISNNTTVDKSIEYAITIFVGILKIKNGDLKEGAMIITEAINTFPKVEKIEIIARDILWQTQYKLDQKLESTKTLNNIYQLDKTNLEALKIKSNINFEIKDYNAAILDFDKIIAAESKIKAKDKYLEKRGDSYFNAKQYDKAKSDYNVITTKAMDTKIITTDKAINSNSIKIKGFQDVDNLTPVQKSNLLDLYIQNGNKTNVEKLLNSIDMAKINTTSNSIQLQKNTLEALKRSNYKMKPEVKSTIESKLNSILVKEKN